jgi:hypothetical protein
MRPLLVSYTTPPCAQSEYRVYKYTLEIFARLGANEK